MRGKGYKRKGNVKEEKEDGPGEHFASSVNLREEPEKSKLGSGRTFH